ncbi:MAG: type II CAAX endopeptidase family protein [Anaerolineae bacterium]|jgi:membrane protease YdiL (CAAX protease family)
MDFIKSIFWNSEEARIKALWRLIAQGIVFLVLFVPLGIPVSFLTVVMMLGQQSDLSDPQSIERLMDPLAVERFIAETPLLSGLYSLTVLIAILVSVWLVGRFLDRRRLADFGLRLDRDWWIDFAFGLVLGGVLMLAVFLVELALGWVAVQDTFVTRDADASFLIALLSPLISFLAVGFYEELFSRGYQLRNMAEGLNGSIVGRRGAIVLAAILSSLVFGLLHAANPNASWVSTLNLVLAGLMLLAMGVLLTGELAIPIGLHITWNFFQGNVFGFPVSGTDFRSATFIQIEQGGPEAWTGGAFGPEGGLIGLVAMALGALLTILWVRWRHGRAGLHLGLAEPPSGFEKGDGQAAA